MGKRAFAFGTTSAWTLILFITLCTASACSSNSPERLILVGGGDHHQEALSRFVDWSGGKNSQILVVSWATESPDDTFGYLQDDLREFHPGSISHAVGREALVHSKLKFIEQVRAASGIFFTGGDQNLVLDAVGAHPELGSLFLEVYRKGTIMAGTSAGTAIMSAMTLTGRNVGSGIEASDVELRLGLGLLQGLIVDQHFLKRQRFGRLLSALKKTKFPLGLGIDENAALAIEANRFASVVGNYKVIAIESSSAARQYAITEIQAGDIYDLQTRRLLNQ